MKPSKMDKLFDNLEKMLEAFLSICVDVDSANENRIL